MIPRRIANATHHLGPPEGWDHEKDGKCDSLYVRQVGDVYESAWEPTPTELAAINAGASIILRMKFAQVPVMLCVAGQEG